MSIRQYPETAAAAQLQVWNNAAFDGEEYEGFSFPMKASWSSLHSTESLRSDCSKENLSPAALNSTPVPAAKPLRSTAKKKNKGFDEREDEKKIDDEIQEIENEIKRLSSRLEALRLQKASAVAAAAAAKTAERRGRIVAAKFMEQKQSSTAVKITEETPKAKVGAMTMRRGVSLGPAEISAGGGRFSSRPGKANIFNVITPVPATQSRRKSCFWKLGDVDEVKGVRERKKTLSLSPKSKRNMGVQKQGAATVTVGSRKSVKKEDGVVALVQPRKLFKEGEKSVPNKRPTKPGRVVASRYNQIVTGNNNNNNSNNNSVAVDARKRSLPENDKDDDSKRWDKRRASLRGSGQGSEVRVKKRWEIPAQVKVCEKSEEEEEVVVVVEEKPLVSMPSTAGVSGMLLPKIRTFRYPNESPRDSGAAKRVADLTGKRSYFCPDEDNQDTEASVCLALSFAEDDADEEG